MPQQKPTIVPVTLHQDRNAPASSVATTNIPTPGCIIKAASLEITFFNGADEHVIQTVVRELKHFEM